jgi:hypothetical protein
MLSEHSSTTVGEVIGDLGNDLVLIEDCQTLRPLLAQLPPGNKRF